MGSEASNKETRDAVGSENMSPTIGPKLFPRGELGRGGSSGNVFGDPTHRDVPSDGEELCMGVSERWRFHEADDKLQDEIGQGRNESNGKPKGPQQGTLSVGGAAAKFVWG